VNEGDTIREALDRLHGSEIEKQREEALTELNHLETRVRVLEALLVAHHAVGVLDGSVIGDDCPICTRMMRP
jgi:hypothetical protein